MENDEKEFVVPLSISIGTVIDQRYVDAAYKEAAACTDGRTKRAWLAYAKSLQKRLDEVNNLDKYSK